MGSYKETLNLPKTEFPMRANLPQREPEILKRWESQNYYKRLRQRQKGKPRFILHDGPPFANGDIHLGHVLNKVLKDVIVRYKNMRGFDAPYVPGWDCHGLPIEHKVAKDLGSKSQDVLLLRQKCEATAKRFMGVQRESFKRLGIAGDWEKPYVTLDAPYEADELRVFANLVEKGWVYEGLRPVYWSTGCRTALAEAEVEYKDRTDTSVFVKFPVLDEAGLKRLRQKSQLNQAAVHLVVWTTTPWTLPANLAVAVHPDLKYVTVVNQDEIWLIAGSRLAELERITQKTYKPLSSYQGSELVKIKYRHPFLDRQGEILSADFVTADSGSGLVHIAPGHGHDDYVVGQTHGLTILSPVDRAGRFTEECGVAEWVGQNVFKVNPLVVERLKKDARLIGEEPLNHSYPHCWRSQTPIVFRAVKQWFIRVDAFRDKALKAIEAVQWIPDWGMKRIQSHVAERHDWCISRQRAWGVPIPVFYDAKDKPLLDAAVIRRFADWAERSGANVWFTASDAEMQTKLKLKAGFTRGRDTLDVWIDSGSSFLAVSKKQNTFPADLYLEGSDQHRGWFQSSLLLACATIGKPPYKAVLTHGFVVDRDGRKMSKSLGNVIAPQTILQKLGADILRLWVVSSGFTEDVRVSEDIFARMSDSYRKFRNTFKYILGNLHGFDSKQRIKQPQMLEMDQWILSKLAGVVKESTDAYDQHQYHRFYQLIYKFCVQELSSFYFDILKDRLYVDGLNSRSGISARSALSEIFHVLVRLLAPVLTFTTEEAWSYFSGDEHSSIHLEDWPSNLSFKQDKSLEARWGHFTTLRDPVLKRLEEKREAKEIGNPLEAKLDLYVADKNQELELKKSQALLQSIFLVSEVFVHPAKNGDGLSVEVTRTSLPKCSRCWTHTSDVGKQSDELCARCHDVVQSLKQS